MTGELCQRLENDDVADFAKKKNQLQNDMMTGFCSHNGVRIWIKSLKMEVVFTFYREIPNNCVFFF